ncbi:MtrAB system accessory lipoprotein LpqB [uncultured Corynebacterium sp.]|uniref:MtrAB system accessory lipoprotein LpqB n=1 Tax=uncultured Corynebacterium sp. TaxID=159447 RepID=UPI0025F14DDC|nr:MtrAB system accessory lipoprotein LpqB [uncultured Corynebacterium sp.]
MKKNVTAVICACSALALVTGCTTLPGKSTPEAISSYAPAPSQVDVPKPRKNQPSDLLLRDFFGASSHPLSRHEAARQFLTQEATDRWDSEKTVLILDRIDIASDGEATSDHITYKVRGNIVGRLGVGGVYMPEYTAFQTTYELVKSGDEWRVDNLPNAVVMDRAEFTRSYESRPIYFFNPEATSLVPDRRWVYNRQQSPGASAISLLTAGPQPALVDGVKRLLPEGATAQVSRSEQGGFSVEFSGLTDMSADVRKLVAAQVIWTLASADVRGPYELKADGSPLLSDRPDGVMLQDVSQYDPNAPIEVPLRAVSNGVVYNDVDSGKVNPIDGWLRQSWVESASVSPRDSIFAAVMGRGDEPRRLLIGPQDGQPQTATRGKSLTRPSWTPDGDTVYTVADGKKVLRLTRNTASDLISETEVDSSALESLVGNKSRISVFRISHTGARAVMIIDGRVYVSVIEVGDDGNLRLGKPMQVANQLGDTAVTADWHVDGSLIVGTKVNDAPVFNVAMDGSVVTQLSAQNLSAPVVSVASTKDTIYATDARALMKLRFDDEETRFWREVSSLQSQRAVPLLAY